MSTAIGIQPGARALGRWYRQAVDMPTHLRGCPPRCCVQMNPVRLASRTRKYFGPRRGPQLTVSAALAVSVSTPWRVWACLTCAGAAGMW